VEIVNRVGIREDGGIWEFINEVAIEDFLWDNLGVLWGLIPLQRQWNINGQICDILALDQDRSLVILELKNTEDRYILQQLTRYYDVVIQAKPFLDKVDYSKPIRLLAIKPQFHRDNYTDRQYSKLHFEFWQFSISESNKSLFLELTNDDSQETKQVEIPYQSREENHDLPALPTALSKVLATCPPEQQAEVLRIREKILTFDKRIQEISTAGNVKYGNGNVKRSKFCAEFYIDKGEILIFLWLPLKNGTSEKMLGRARLWTDWQGKTLVEGYVNSGVGTDINAHKRMVNNLIKKLYGKRNSSYSFRFCKTGRSDIWIGLDVDNATVSKYLNISNLASEKICKLEPITIISSEEIELITTVIPIEEQIEKEIFMWDVDIQSVYKNLDYFVNMALKRWLSRI
jgi:RecB family endonuclease NucS